MVARRIGVLVTVAGAVLALAAPGVGAAVKPAAHPKIGPNQEFVGLVNGSAGIAAHAQIRVACPGPGSPPGETTHPLAGQTLAVSLPASTAGSPGETGPKVKTINAYMGIPPSAASSAGGIASFKHYGKPKPIPTTLTVPCSGSGYITFLPMPRDPGVSRGFVVPVDYVNIAT